MGTKWQWDDVRFFLAVAREGTLSGAARALGEDRVTVGRRVAQIERDLGVKLLTRTPEGFVPTAAGVAIMRESEAMQAAALDLERVAAGQDGRTAGTVRVSATDALAYRIVVPSIAAVRRKHPQIQIDLLTGVRSLDVRRRETDLALRFARPTDPGLVGRKLGEVGFTLYAARTYLARRGTPERGAGLRDCDLLCFTGSPAASRPFFLGESLEGARIAARCNNPFLQLKAAADGLGVCEAACFLGDAFPGVVRVWPAEPPILRVAWLVMHEDLRRTSRIRVVADEIASAFRRASRELRSGGRVAGE